MKTIDQEEILRLIQNNSWKPVLTFLYKNKKEIGSDPLLQFTTQIFQSEFFKKLNADDSSISLDNLEQLYILNHGKFFVLGEENYKSVVQALATRTDGKIAYKYAMLFPTDEVCKKIINDTPDRIKEPNKSKAKPKIEHVNWIEIYNRLFELVNNQDDQKTYFSGPRFINTLRKFHKYHPNYSQYIELRNQQGKSTSRKIFYYDILMELDEKTRTDFVLEIIDTIEPFEKARVIPIKALIRGASVSRPEPKEAYEESDVATVFISYSWDDENHKNWVLELANKLVEDGIDVLLDRYDLKAGKSLTHFIESSISKADKIIIVFTPNYKLKATNRRGGVGYEYSIMNAELYQNQTDNDRIIPVLRKGRQKESIPEFMQQYIHLDMTNDSNFELSFTDLKREILDEPEIVKPKLGKKKPVHNSS